MVGNKIIYAKLKIRAIYCSQGKGDINVLKAKVQDAQISSLLNQRGAFVRRWFPKSKLEKNTAKKRKRPFNPRKIMESCGSISNIMRHNNR